MKLENLFANSKNNKSGANFIVQKSVQWKTNFSFVSFFPLKIITRSLKKINCNFIDSFYWKLRHFAVSMIQSRKRINNLVYFRIRNCLWKYAIIFQSCPGYLQKVSRYKSTQIIALPMSFISIPVAQFCSFFIFCDRISAITSTKARICLKKIKSRSCYQRSIFILSINSVFVVKTFEFSTFPSR